MYLWTAPLPALGYDHSEAIYKKTMSLPDVAPILELIDAFRRSKAMLTAVSMGAFEALHEGPADAGALAARLRVSGHALERLLDACVGLGLLRKQDGAYANQAVAETYLCDHSPHSLSGYVRYSDEALFPMWVNLEDAMREGTDRWTQTFGWHGSLFDNFFKTEGGASAAFCAGCMDSGN